MNKLPCLLLLLTVVAPSSSAQLEWLEFGPKDGSFKVLLPGKPTEHKKSIKQDGNKVEVLLFEVAAGPGSGKFVVGYSEFPEASIKPGTEDKRLDNARDGAVAGVKGKLLRQEMLFVHGHPGRELLIKIDDKSMVIMRLYAVKNRLYQLVVVGSEELVTGRDAEKFLTSFKLPR
jgi:hypothetical protein